MSFYTCFAPIALLIIQLSHLSNAQQAKYVLVFGDSYSTTSSWAAGTAPSSANPIGNPNFPGQTTSGGVNWVGQAISQLNSSLVLAYDFAVSGATIDTAIVETWAGSGVDDQVDLFGQYVADTAPLTAENTLVVVWIGINDVGHPYWDGIESPTTKIMSRYLELLETLYNHGLRNFVLFTVPPFDRAPAFLSEPADKVQGLRDDIVTYNKEVANVLEQFKSANPGASGQIFDTSPSFVTALDNPTAFGAPDATCVNQNGVSCLWYDTYHPGIAIHKLLAQAFYDSVHPF